jgi:hypothetical protein
MAIIPGRGGRKAAHPGGWASPSSDWLKDAPAGAAANNARAKLQASSMRNANNILVFIGFPFSHVNGQIPIPQLPRGAFKYYYKEFLL